MIEIFGEGARRLDAVEKQAAMMAAAEGTIERGYAHLGWMILEVAEMQYWRVHHDTFRDYLKYVAMKAAKTPGQLQRYFLTVRDLSDTFTPEQLEIMGITKAMKLRAAKDYAIVLPQAVVNAALDPDITSAELKKIVSVALKMPEEDGDWFDLEAEFYVTPEERATIEDAIKAAERDSEYPTNVKVAESAQRKDVILKWCMEYLGAHGDGQ